MTSKSEQGKRYDINVDDPSGGDVYRDVTEWEIDEGTGRLEFTAHSTYTGMEKQTYKIITTKPFTIYEDYLAVPAV